MAVWFVMCLKSFGGQKISLSCVHVQVHAYTREYSGWNPSIDILAVPCFGMPKKVGSSDSEFVSRCSRMCGCVFHSLLCTCNCWFF